MKQEGKESVTANPTNQPKHRRRHKGLDDHQVARLRERRMRELDRAYTRHTRQLKHVLQALARKRSETSV